MSRLGNGMKEMNPKEMLETLKVQHKSAALAKIRDARAWRKQIEIDAREIQEKVFEKMIAGIYTWQINYKVARKRSKNLRRILDKPLIPENLHRRPEAVDQNGMDERKRMKIKKLTAYLVSSDLTPARYVDVLAEYVRTGKKPDPDFVGLGPKTNEDQLKDFGYFEFIPFDSQTKRMLARTGLLAYGLQKHNSRVDWTDTNEGWKNLMKMVFKGCGVMIGGYDLGKPRNIGLIDILLYQHAKAVCTDRPVCINPSGEEECVLQRKGLCEFGRGPTAEDLVEI